MTDEEFLQIFKRLIDTGRIVIQADINSEYSYGTSYNYSELTVFVDGQEIHKQTGSVDIRANEN